MSQPQRLSSPRVSGHRRRRTLTFALTKPLQRSISTESGLHKIATDERDEMRANYRECSAHHLVLPSQSLTRIDHADVTYKQPNDRAGAVRYIKHLRFQLYANQRLQSAFDQRVLDTSHDHEMEQVVDGIRRIEFEMRFGDVSLYDELFVNSWQDGHSDDEADAETAVQAAPQAERAESATSSGVSSTSSSPAVSPLKRLHQSLSPSSSSSSSGVSSESSPPSALRPKITACRKRSASKPTAPPAPIMSITQPPPVSAAESCSTVNIKALIALWESRVVEAAAKHDLYTAMPIYYRANMAASWRRANEARDTGIVDQAASVSAEQQEEPAAAPSPSISEELPAATSSTPIAQPAPQFFERQPMLTVYREMQAAKTQAKAAPQPDQPEPMASPPVVQQRAPALCVADQMQQAKLMAARHPKLFVSITAIENRNINYNLASTDDEAFVAARNTMSAAYVIPALRPNRLRDESLGRMLHSGRAY